MKAIYITLLTILASINGMAQTDFLSLKQNFINHRKANKQDSALLVARYMNQLALKEEGDTSYWYALSMRYIGNPYYTLNKTDSCLEYWHRSLTLFETNHRNHPDIPMSFNNLGVLYSDLRDYEKAEKYYLQSLEIRQKIYSEDHPD
ncbi:tetratricopeptide repeat protein, partial [Bacteroidia bacterium]|nr:tetratricopeptide repeat protein [Bacteroidia bacterium]